jgi:hypothetical protein
VPCTSPAKTFPVTSGTNTSIGDLPLTCTISSQVDNSGSAMADVSVSTVNTTQNNIVETFTYGPRTVNGKSVGGQCTFPSTIALNVANTNTAIHYSWTSTPDGTFALNTTNTAGTYTCQTPGNKQLTVTGTETVGGQTVTSSKQVTVSCAPCGVCGNGILEPGEQCDDTTAHCGQPGTANACKIIVTCGDNIVDPPETCDPPNGTTCNSLCQLGEPCGDGIIEAGEQCDNGSANSDTKPNACRTNCTNPKCGDGVIDTGETCDPPNGTTCPATCQCEGKSCVCLPCIRQSQDAAAQAQYCDVAPACVSVETCVLNAGCFNPLPAFCYCGTTDVAGCAAASFTPVGPCHTEIRTGEPSAQNNADALQQLFDFTSPTGVAFQILNDVNVNVPACQTLCF